jgi:hypothetical protein
MCFFLNNSRIKRFFDQKNTIYIKLTNYSSNIQLWIKTNYSRILLLWYQQQRSFYHSVPHKLPHRKRKQKNNSSACSSIKLNKCILAPNRTLQIAIHPTYFSHLRMLGNWIQKTTVNRRKRERVRWCWSGWPVSFWGSTFLGGDGLSDMPENWVGACCGPESGGVSECRETARCWNNMIHLVIRRTSMTARGRRRMSTWAADHSRADSGSHLELWANICNVESLNFISLPSPFEV